MISFNIFQFIVGYTVLTQEVFAPHHFLVWLKNEFYGPIPDMCKKHMSNIFWFILQIKSGVWSSENVNSTWNGSYTKGILRLIWLDFPFDPNQICCWLNCRKKFSMWTVNVSIIANIISKRTIIEIYLLNEQR